MGKRSDKFPRENRDFYKTPRAAVEPLVNFLPTNDFTFAEPCAGDGRLIRHITDMTNNRATCLLSTDIEPQDKSITKKDVFALEQSDVQGIDLIITNPPWDRRPSTGRILHRMIHHFTYNLNKPTWLLFDADWMHTVQAAPFLPSLVTSVSIGRVKWIEGSTMTGKDNCQWALFHKHARFYHPAPMLFGRGQELPVGLNLYGS